MPGTSEKARAQRLERLKGMVEKRLENPSAALEALLSELLSGEPHADLWEGLHAAAVRDGMEQELAGAYLKITHERRLHPLEPRFQADVLVHAADFHLGVLGDGPGAEVFLERVQHVVPGHEEAFTRLERRLVGLDDPRRLVELHAIVAGARPASAGDLVSRIVNKVVPLPATAPLSDDACKRLAALAPGHPVLLGVIDTHCRKTKRFALSGALLEELVSNPALPNASVVEGHKRLVELYMGDAGTPERAIGHVEALLDRSPGDETARAAADRLLSNREVAGRAAAALQKARRGSRPPSRPPAK